MRGNEPCTRSNCNRMTKQSIADSQFLGTVGPYLLCIVLALTFFQVVRLVLSMTIAFLMPLFRAVLFVLSWPLHLLTLPVRALIFLTSITLKIALYGGTAAIVYMLLGGALTISDAVKEAFDKILQRPQATV